LLALRPLTAALYEQRRRRQMAHKVRFTSPDLKLGNSDIEFLVKNNNAMVGRLLISKGNVEWRSRNKKNGKKLSWRRFDELMQTKGR
jgi:hypothetical protein